MRRSVLSFAALTLSALLAIASATETAKWITNLVTKTREADPAAASLATTSAQFCDAGWWYYSNADGSEKHASCWKEFSYENGADVSSGSGSGLFGLQSGGFWNGEALCHQARPGGSGLLSFKSAQKGYHFGIGASPDTAISGGYRSGLLGHVTQNMQVPIAYVGCYQEGYVIPPFDGENFRHGNTESKWKWVDGTPKGNLVCKTPEDQDCEYDNPSVNGPWAGRAGTKSPSEPGAAQQNSNGQFPAEMGRNCGGDFDLCINYFERHTLDYCAVVMPVDDQVEFGGLVSMPDMVIPYFICEYKAKQ